jgi:hypothetical protein
MCYQLAGKFALVCDAVASPVPVIVTCPFAVWVFVWPEYCTAIVQLPPGAITVVLVHVPPVIEKVPFPVPLAFAIVGANVNVNGLAVGPVAMLLTVIVPVFVPKPPLFNAGLGPENAIVAPVTVNVTGVLVPPGVVTVTFLAPSVAPRVIVNVVVIVVPVEFTVKVPWVTPLVQPERVQVMVTAVAPVRFAPLIVTLTVVPRTPELGEMEVSVGVGAGGLWNSTAPTSM